MDLVYLLNACGEDTGHGAEAVSEEDAAKVPSEDGPGVVLPYLVEAQGRKFVMGNLEVCFKDAFWGPDQGAQELAEEAAAKRYVEKVAQEVSARLRDGEFITEVGEDMPGRYCIGVGIPLEQVQCGQHAKEKLERLFGKFAELEDLE